jgi:hypothetical protein
LHPIFNAPEANVRQTSNPKSKLQKASTFTRRRIQRIQDHLHAIFYDGLLSDVLILVSICF